MTAPSLPQLVPQTSKIFGKPMRVRIEVGSIGGDGSQTLAPPVVVAFQLSASPPMPAR